MSDVIKVTGRLSDLIKFIFPISKDHQHIFWVGFDVMLEYGGEVGRPSANPAACGTRIRNTASTKAEVRTATTAKTTPLRRRSRRH
jgi:hypothetical protein